MTLDASVFIDLIVLFCLFRLVRGQSKILEKFQKLELDKLIEKNQGKEEVIQNNLGRRLLEIQEGRYARPYTRRSRGE